MKIFDKETEIVTVNAIQMIPRYDRHIFYGVRAESRALKWCKIHPTYKFIEVLRRVKTDEQ
jgi:hypothetical protein